RRVRLNTASSPLGAGASAATPSCARESAWATRRPPESWPPASLSSGPGVKPDMVDAQRVERSVGGAGWSVAWAMVLSVPEGGNVVADVGSLECRLGGGATTRETNRERSSLVEVRIGIVPTPKE